MLSIQCQMNETHLKIYISDIYEKPSVMVTSPGSPDLHSMHRNRMQQSRIGANDSNIGGRIQVKLALDNATLSLAVTIVCAAGLMTRTNGTPRSPYAKVILLPDLYDKSKRRTKPIANTNDPRWGQTFIYSGIRRCDLKSLVIEVTVWDYVRYGANDFLGEVLLELGICPLDNEPVWYYLIPHDEASLRRLECDGTELDMVLTPTDHLSPPSTTSRLSDSDTTSECDLECDPERMRRVADGASISSVGSSSSPPPEVDLCDRRSRRDMSPQGRRRVMGVVYKEPRSQQYNQGHNNNNNNNNRVSPVQNP